MTTKTGRASIIRGVTQAAKSAPGTASFVEKYWLIGDAADGSTNMDEEGKFSPWYKTADKSKWVVPTQTHLNLINTNLIFSKQRAFLVSATRDKVSGDYIGCYFPLAGNGSSPANVYGYYLSATPSLYGVGVRGGVLSVRYRTAFLG